MDSVEINIKAFIPVRENIDLKELRALPMHELLTVVYQNGKDMSRQIKKGADNGANG